MKLCQKEKRNQKPTEQFNFCSVGLLFLLLITESELVEIFKRVEILNGGCYGL